MLYNTKMRSLKDKILEEAEEVEKRVAKKKKKLKVGSSYKNKKKKKYEK